MPNCTIYEDIFSNKAHYIKVSKALDRIRTGRSRAKIDEIRATLDKSKADVLKRELPSVCFSGVFEGKRTDECLKVHSGFLVLDFDEVTDISGKADELAQHQFIHAVWLSPRGNGIKALVRIADGKKHREHFQALQEIFPEVDRSGINESRVCYESYDPNIYINEQSNHFTKVKSVERIETKQALDNEKEIFERLLKWLSNRNDAFVKGERNTFIFKLAASCCRFGLHEDSAKSLILAEYPPSNDFTGKEAEKAIQSGYRSNKQQAGTASFEKDILVDKISRKEIVIDDSIYDESIKPRDVIYGADVKLNARNIYLYGHASVRGIGVQPLDELYKAKRGEITVLTGIGNYGKSTLFKWYLLMRVLVFGEKFAIFPPEDLADEFYFDFVEMLLGCDCTPQKWDGTPNLYRPIIQVYDNAYDFVSRHIFYIYPKDLTPTPDYIKERFLELIIKEKVSGVAIDPWNQMTHDYGSSGGRSDKYLETVLGDFSRFAKANDVYFFIVAHPKLMKKQANGNYECPDVFDIADGAMWSNKSDNILVFHKPFQQTSPEDPTCEFYTKKIRRQKSVGKRGFINLHYIRRTRRFEFDGIDYMGNFLRERQMDFSKAILDYKPIEIKPPSDFAPF